MAKKLFCLLLAAALLGAAPALAETKSGLEASEAAIALIKYYEGFSATPYEDGAGLAIGYGTHYDETIWPDGITEAEADAVMRAEVAVFGARVNAMADRLGLTLSQQQFDALVSLTYNLGAGWMTAEYRLYNMLASGVGYYSDETIVNAFARYSYYNGELFEPLIRRRLTEARIFLYGDYRFGGSPVYEFGYEERDDGDFILYTREPGLTDAAFSDMYHTQWFYRYVSPLYYVGVVDGYADGSFRPYGSVSCGEAAKLILLAAGREEQAATGAHWASGYLDLAVAEGLLAPEEAEAPDRYIDRAAVARLTALALGLPAADAAPFTDTDDPHVAALYAAGVVEGSYGADGSLVYRPDSHITRGELCAILWRLMNR